MVSAVEMAVNPKKRVFLALVLFSAIVTAIILFFVWKSHQQHFGKVFRK